MGNNQTNAVVPAAPGSFRDTPYPLCCKEQVMCSKAHGTCPQPVMKHLRWGCDWETSDRICCFNRHDTEDSGYFLELTAFMDEMVKKNDSEIIFYDSVTGKPLFSAPRGRTMEEFKRESINHGWPSFRDAEVIWDNVRCLPSCSGEMISLEGTHLGHNMPDDKGNRYCINLVSIAGSRLPAPPLPVSHTVNVAPPTPIALASKHHRK